MPANIPPKRPRVAAGAKNRRVTSKQQKTRPANPSNSRFLKKNKLAQLRSYISNDPALDDEESLDGEKPQFVDEDIDDTLGQDDEDDDDAHSDVEDVDSSDIDDEALAKAGGISLSDLLDDESEFGNSIISNSEAIHEHESESSNSDEDDFDHEQKHTKLISLVNNLRSVSRELNEHESNENVNNGQYEGLTESEHSSALNSSQLRLNDLIDSITKNQNIGQNQKNSQTNFDHLSTVQTTLRSLNRDKQSSRLQAPLSDVKQDELTRKTAYKATVEELQNGLL